MAMCASTLAQAAEPQGPCPFFDVAVVQKFFEQIERSGVQTPGKTQSVLHLHLERETHEQRQDGRAHGEVSFRRAADAHQGPTLTEAKDQERVLLSYSKQQLTPVPELGQYAVWSPQRRQLAWIAKGHIFHVAVENDD